MKMKTYPFTADAVFKEFRHSRMLLAGIQGAELDPRLKHSGVTSWESSSLHSYLPFFKGDAFRFGQPKKGELFMQRRTLAFCLFVCFLEFIFARAQLFAAEQPYYEGKTLRIIVSSGPGGGTDTAARLVSRFI